MKKGMKASLATGGKVTELPESVGWGGGGVGLVGGGGEGGEEGSDGERGGRGRDEGAPGGGGRGKVEGSGGLEEEREEHKRERDGEHVFD